MYIKNIEIENFRNYESEKVEFDSKINLIMGQNAQGKTNILEAIYLTSLGKSFRTSKDREMINFNHEYFRVISTFYRDGEGTVEISVNDQGKRIGKINGVKIEKTSQLIDNILAVVFSPEDLKIVKEDPEKRRKFIDRELCQMKVSYYKNLNGYNRILEQRNTYLKEPNMREDILDVWDIQLVEYGKNIIKERSEFVEKLNKISKNIHSKITEGVETLEVTYNKNVEEDQFLDLLTENRLMDRQRGNTSKGPHRDDLNMFVDNINVRNFGSQGQQRTAALSIKLAQIQLIIEETGEIPILLLDDVFSELDSTRQRYLVDFLEDVQIFITAADISEKVINSFPKGKLFKVTNGNIKEENSEY